MYVLAVHCAWTRHTLSLSTWLQDCCASFLEQHINVLTGCSGAAWLLHLVAVSQSIAVSVYDIMTRQAGV